MLLVVQFIYYLQLIDWLNKYVQLIGKGMRDASGFLMLLIGSQLLFALSFHVLGVAFDDGNNFETYDQDLQTGYDSSHNDYPHIHYIWVCYLSALRSSIGDLSVPGYSFW